MKRGEKSRLFFITYPLGIGMNSDEIANIFNKYYQSDPNDNGRGLGLGLAIVSRIVSLAKGQIMVESGKDSGSAFTVFFAGLYYNKRVDCRINVINLSNFTTAKKRGCILAFFIRFSLN